MTSSCQNITAEQQMFVAGQTSEVENWLCFSEILQEQTVDFSDVSLVQLEILKWIFTIMI